MSRNLKLLLTAAIAIGGVLFIAFQSTGDVEYYVHVDKLYQSPEKYLDKTIQVHGYARNVPTKGEIRDQKIVREFDIESNGQTLHVIHEGSVPDTFKNLAETVVKGRLTVDDKGVYLLTTVGGEKGIMAKCPSRYQGKK